MKLKAHPLMIFDSVKPFWWVLIIPLLRALFQLLRNGEVSGILLPELLLLACIFLFAFVNFFFFRLIFDSEKIIIQKGFIFKSRSVIMRKNLSSVQIERNPLDYLFGAVTYRINTEAGLRRRSDFCFKLSGADSKKLSKELYGSEKLEKVHFSAVKVALMAISTSSAFTGLVIGAPVINNVGRLLGIGFSQLLDEINSVSHNITAYFPPIVNLITLIFIIGYGISFVYSFIKYINFKLYLNNNILKVCSGFFVKRITYFSKSAVNDVKIEQTPFMLLFRRFAMSVSVGGFSVSKNSSQIIVPAGTKKEIKGQFVSYFPFLEPDGIDVKAEQCKKIRNRFMFWPVIYFSSVSVVSLFFIAFFTEFTRLIFFLTVTLFAIIFYYAYMCDYEYRHGKVNFGKSTFAHSVKGFRTCRLYCPSDRIGHIKLTRFPIDIKQNTCRIKIAVCSESADSIRIRHLDYEDTVSQINKSFNTKV